jgi:hypothetical protein
MTLMCRFVIRNQSTHLLARKLKTNLNQSQKLTKKFIMNIKRRFRKISFTDFTSTLATQISQIPSFFNYIAYDALLLEIIELRTLLSIRLKITSFICEHNTIMHLSDQPHFVRTACERI